MSSLLKQLNIDGDVRLVKKMYVGGNGLEMAWPLGLAYESVAKGMKAAR